MAYRLDMRGTLATRYLISFRGNGHGDDVMMQQPGTQLLVLEGWGMTQVHNMHHGPQGMTLLQIGFHHRSPARLHLTQNSGITIAGEINEQEALVHEKKVNDACFARRRTRLDQVLTMHEGINQRGLPDVRTPGKSHFRERLTWVLCWGDGASDKYCGRNLHGKYDSRVGWTVADTGDSHVSDLFPCGRYSMTCLPQRRATPTMIFGTAMHNGFQLIVGIAWHLRRWRRRLPLPTRCPGCGDKHLAHRNIEYKETQGQDDEPRPVIFERSEWLSRRCKQHVCSFRGSIGTENLTSGTVS